MNHELHFHCMNFYDQLFSANFYKGNFIRKLHYDHEMFKLCFSPFFFWLVIESNKYYYIFCDLFLSLFERGIRRF